MRDWSWSPTWFMPLLSVFVALLIGAIAIIVVAAPTQSAGMAQLVTEKPAITGAEPLPGGCIRTGPPGTPDAVCCISGYVYLDGKPIAGVKITIQKANGGAKSIVYTGKYTDDATLPSYRLDLTAQPLGIQPDDLISISAEYGDYKKDLTYKVHPSGQQVDIVLLRNQTSEFQFERQLEPAPPEAFGFNQPNGVATDSSGNVYVLDQENARVIVFADDGKFLRQWGRFGSGPGQFRGPLAIAIDRQQNYVYVVDYIPVAHGAGQSMNRLQRFNLYGVLLGQLDNRLPSQPLPALIGGITVDGVGDLYLAGGSEIWKINFTGQILTKWGQAGSGDGQFNSVKGLAFDSAGDLYVVDSGNHRVQKFSNVGAFIKKWGSQGNGDGQFLNPSGIALDSSNNVYVVDSGNHRVEKLSSDGTLIKKWGDLGNATFQFNNPLMIAVGNAGVYIADTGNHRIQQFSFEGDSTRHWGSFGGTTCFFNPGVMTINNKGVLRVANAYDGSHQNNRCMSQFQPDGTQLANWSIPTVYNNVTSDANDNVYGLLQLNDEYVVDKFDNTGHQLFNQHLTSLKDVNGFAVDGNGNIYVDGNNTTSGQDQIDILDSTTGEWKKIGTMSFPDTIALAVDKTNDLYVARHNHNVLRFDSTGLLKGTLANASEESYILSIAVAPNNHLFVVDTDGNYRLQELDETDHLVSGWNPPVGEINNSDIYTPTQVLVDNTNHVYVIEKGGGTFWDDGILKVYRPMTFTLPIATINYSSRGNSMLQSETLDLYGTGQDNDAAPGDPDHGIAAYKWESSLNGVLGTAATLKIPANQLALGKHQITLTVKDNQGEWSAPISLPITVLADATPTPVDTTTPQPTLTPDPNATPTPPAAQQWTFLLYLDGDYNDWGQLSQRFASVIKQFQQRNLPATVNLAIQVDGPNNGDSQRFLFQHDTQGNTVMQTSPVNSTNEAAMDNPDTLTAFVLWGQGQFTNTHYYLAIADHGQAVSGIAWDYTSDMRDDGVPNFSAHLTVKTVGEALHAAGVKPLDILHLDACSMNLLETAYELKDVAGILISSQYLAWDYFSYPAYVADIGNNMQPSALASKIVKTYADTVARDNHPYTISALNLQRVGAADLALSALITELNTVQQSGQVTLTTLAAIRAASQTFESDGDYLNRPDDLYVDLKDWLQRLNIQVTAGAVPTRIDELLAVLTGNDPLILDTRSHTDTLPERYADGRQVNLQDAHGLSIFYPRDQSNQAFRQYVGNQLFNFTTHSAWRTFLDGHSVLSPGPLAPLPGPSKLLESGANQIFLPIVLR